MKSARPRKSPRSAFAAACDLLARRPHTCAEVRRKLFERGYGPEEVAQTIERLCGEGVLNDEAVALRWGEILVEQRCWGEYRIRQFLFQRGVPRDIIDRVGQELRRSGSEADTARRALAGRFRDGPGPTRRKVAAFLRARGFTTEIQVQLASEYPSDHED